MYLDFSVPIPDTTGKISRQKTPSGTYVHYILGRVYDPKKKHTVPKRVIIGRVCPDDNKKMIPNERFLEFFPRTPLPEQREQAERCTTLKAGPFMVFDKIVRHYGLDKMAEKNFGKNAGLLLDLASYMVIEERDQGQYYPDYAYRRPIFTEGMRISSDSAISRFLSGVTDEQICGFLNDWNAARDHDSRIYISYDSTNKNCQAGEIDFVEFGKAKSDDGLPIVNIGLAYDKTNQVPLFYELYPGSINDVSQFRFFVDKALAYNYRNVGFILDRGYFSKANIAYLDEHKFAFVLMIKGCKPLVADIIDEVRDSFEDSFRHSLRQRGLSGVTLERKLFDQDAGNRYFHLFFNPAKKARERMRIQEEIARMQRIVASFHGKPFEPGREYTELFEFHFDKDGNLLFGEVRHDVVDAMYRRCGYFCIVTSEKMTAQQAYDLYRSRDASEKIFRSDKTFLGSKSMRVHSGQAMAAKTFVEFVGLIIRQRFYTLLKNEILKLPVRKNYTTVPAALRELDKIELVRINNKSYQLDHAATKTQETILNAFGMTKNDVMEQAALISARLAEAEKQPSRDEPEEDFEEELMEEDCYA